MESNTIGLKLVIHSCYISLDIVGFCCRPRSNPTGVFLTYSDPCNSRDRNLIKFKSDTVDIHQRILDSGAIRQDQEVGMNDLNKSLSLKKARVLCREKLA